MNEEEKVNILANTFDLMDELIRECVCEDEVKTRIRIKEKVEDLQGKATTEEEKAAIRGAYKNLTSMSIEDLLEMRETLLIDHD